MKKLLAPIVSLSLFCTFQTGHAIVEGGCVRLPPEEACGYLFDDTHGNSALRLRIPNAFKFDTEDSELEFDEDNEIFYSYSDDQGRSLFITIKKYDAHISLQEYFFDEMNQMEGDENIVFKDLKFQSMPFDGFNAIRCQSYISFGEELFGENVNMFFREYLLTRGVFGFSITGFGPDYDRSDIEAIIEQVIRTVQLPPTLE